jgi:hypothetical protein
MGDKLMPDIRINNHGTIAMLIPLSENRSRGPILLSRSPYRSEPSTQKEVPPAKRASIRQKEPVEHLLDSISDAYASKIYRSAMWTARREHTLQ